MKKLLLSVFFSVFLLCNSSAQQNDELIVQIDLVSSRNSDDIFSKFNSIEGAQLSSYCLEKGLFVLKLNRENIGKHTVNDVVRRLFATYEWRFKEGVSEKELLEQFVCFTVLNKQN